MRVTSLLSRILGRQGYRQADNIAWHGLTICILYGLSFGFLAVVILGILVRIRSLFYIPAFGLDEEVVPMLGYGHGTHNYDRVKEAIIKSLGLSLIFSSLERMKAWFKR